MTPIFSILFGLGGSGKSSTIQLLSTWIAEWNPAIIQTNSNLRTETFQIIKLDGIIIGIVSIGDVLSLVKQYQDIFAANNCEIIICVCRKRKSTRDAIVTHLKELYHTDDLTITWEEKIAAAEKSLELPENTVSAEHLLTAAGLSRYIPANIVV